MSSFCACGEVVKTPATVKDHTAVPAVVTLFFPSSSKCGVDAVAQGFIDHSRSATQILSRCGWVTFHDVRAVGVAMEGGHTQCWDSTQCWDGEPLGWVAPCL